MFSLCELQLRIIPQGSRGGKLLDRELQVAQERFGFLVDAVALGVGEVRAGRASVEGGRGGEVWLADAEEVFVEG